MGLARRCASGFSSSGTFSQDAHLTRSDRDPDADHIGSCKAAAQLLRPDALACYHLTVPAIEAKDAVGFGNDAPAFEIVEGDPIGLTGFNMIRLNFGCELAQLRIG